MKSVATQLPCVSSVAPKQREWMTGTNGLSEGSRRPTVGEAYSPLGSFGPSSLLMAILSPFLALSTTWAPKCLLAVVVLDIPLEVGTHLFYRENDAALGALGGLSISATTIALGGLYLSWFIRALTDRCRKASSTVHISKALLVYLIVSVISVLVSADRSLALFEVFLLLEATLVYHYVANNIQTKEDVAFVVVLLMVGCLLEEIIFVVMSITVTPATAWNLPVHLHADWAAQGHMMRLGGTVGSPNVAAAYLSISMAAAASVFFAKVRRSYKCLAAAVLALGVVALILTFSRGGWIALTIAVSLITVAVWHHRGLSWKQPVVVLALLAVACLPFYNLISGRLLGDDQGSAQSRIPLMNLAFRIIQDNPVLGVGANNFTVAMGPYLTSEFREGFLFAVHNKYLLVLAETGIGGLLAFLAFLLAALRRGWRIWSLHDPFLSPVALGLVAGLGGHMVHMNVDIFRGRPTQQLIWLIAGLLTPMYRLSIAPAATVGSSRASE